MKKLLLVLSSFLLVVAVSAQKPHINKKDEASVVATSSSTEVCFSGVVSGNGNASSVSAYLVVNVSADTYCFNPAGGAGENGVPGHQDFTITGDSQTFNCRNGKATIQNVCADLNITPDCPNPQWTGEVRNVQVISVVLVINGKELDVTKYY